MHSLLFARTGGRSSEPPESEEKNRQPVQNSGINMKARKAPMLSAASSEMSRRILEFDWSQTPLGAIKNWPQSLKTSVSIILNSQHPMWVGWGPENTFIYNDPYIRVLSQAKHPHALGKPAREVWAEIWDICGPLSDLVYREGKASFLSDVRLFMSRGDYLEETYYSFSYSPILDEAGKVGGLFCPSAEASEKVFSERRLRTLSQLSSTALLEKETKAACLSAITTLGKNPDDVPFVLLYLIDFGRATAQLEGSVGMTAHGRLAPASVSLTETDESGFWPIREVFESAQARIVVVPPCDELPRGLANQQLSQVMVLPVTAPGQRRPIGVVIAGVNPAKKLDASYQTFYELIAGQIAMAIQNARTIEEDKKRANQLAELDRAKTIFFSNISHEFRTPLTLMLGPLEDSLASPNKSLGGEELKLVHRNGQRLLKMVNNLLDFARIEAGRMQAVYEPTDLRLLTEEIASVFRSAMQKANLEFVIKCATLPEAIYVDQEMWEKVVLNLLSNALKYTLKGRVEVTLKWKEGFAEFQVRDTGTGIPDSEVPHLFKRFHRVKGAEARNQEGTGIGLALVQELIKLQGGTISVESQLHHGSTFTVRLPPGFAHLPQDQVRHTSLTRQSLKTSNALVEEAKRWLPGNVIALSDFQETDPKLATSMVRAEETILLADDNADMRDYVCRLLGAKWKVIAVANGQEALAAARQHHPDLILSDVMMPVLDGFGLLKEIRRDPKTREIPLIMLSARAGEESRIEGLASGVDDYLVKPFSARELIARITSQLELSKVRKEARTLRERLLSVFTQAPAGIVMLEGPTHVCSLVNPTALTMICGADRDLLEKPLRQALPELCNQGYLEIFDQVYATGLPNSATNRLLNVAHSDGGRAQYFVDYVFQPKRDANGKVEGIIAVFSDVTERNKAQKALKLTEERLFFALTAARMVAWDWDLETNLVVRSANALELFGLKTNQVSEFFERLPASDRERVHLTLENAIQGRGNYDVEYRAVDSFGRLRWFVDKASVLFENGKAKRVSGVCVDITERKFAEERFRLATEAMSGVLYDWDLETNEIFRSPGLRELTGYDPSEITATTHWWTNQIHPDDFASANRNLQQSFESQEPGLSSEYRLRHKDGHYLWVWDHNRIVYDDSGKPMRMIGCAIGIDKQKRQEILLREQAEELSRSNAELARFAFVASHDLKEPLRTVSNYSQLIAMHSESEQQEKDRYVKYITEGVKRMYELINDLLSYSRLGAKKAEFEKVETNDVVNVALENLASSINESQATISIDHLPRIDADPSQLVQLFQNLIANAIKYRSASPPKIEIKAEEKDGQWVFSVSDNGIGIASEYHEKIFILFQRLHSKDEYGGTGIGLAVCKRIAEHHGGTIWLESKEGVGSTFYFSLQKVASEEKNVYYREREQISPASH